MFLSLPAKGFEEPFPFINLPTLWKNSSTSQTTQSSAELSAVEGRLKGECSTFDWSQLNLQLSVHRGAATEKTETFLCARARLCSRLLLFFFLPQCVRPIAASAAFRRICLLLALPARNSVFSESLGSKFSWQAAA